jgi:hypothetical protein
MVTANEWDFTRNNGRARGAQGSSLAAPMKTFTAALYAE